MGEAIRFGLKDEEIEKIKKILERFPGVEKVIIYGSRAKGNFKKGSDIDLVLMAPKLNLSNLMEISEQIDDLLLPYKVDISLFHQIDNPQLIDHIQRVGLPFI